jgi:16S rRNA processing protein RimM
VIENVVVVGKLGSTYGIHGWLKLNSFTEPADNIIAYQPWYIESGNDWQLMQVEAVREQQNKMIIKLAGTETPECARLLTGKKIAVPRNKLLSLKRGEYYWEDLKGLTVIDQQGVVLGKVIRLLETGSNDVLVIQGQKELAIPYLPGQVIICIDLAQQVIYVNWEPI